MCRPSLRTRPEASLCRLWVTGSIAGPTESGAVGGNPQDVTDEAAVSLLTDSGGRIWFGYAERGNMAVLDRGHIKIFSSKDGPKVEFIQALYDAPATYGLVASTGWPCSETTTFSRSPLTAMQRSTGSQELSKLQMVTCG